MPMVVTKKKTSIVGDRRQSILGTERVIAGEGKRPRRRPPKVQATGIHVDPDVNYGNYKLVNIPNPHLQEQEAAEGEIKVTKGPPKPPRGPYSPRVNRFPVEALRQPNDFFFVPNADKQDMKSIVSRARYLGIKVTVRSNFPYNGQVGLGVWKV